MGFAKVQILPTNLGIPLLYLFFLSLLLEQALLVPTVESLASLAKLEAVAFVAIIPLCCSTLESVAFALIVLLIFFSLFYSPVPVQCYCPVISLFYRAGLPF